MSKSNYDKTRRDGQRIGFRERTIDDKNRVAIPKAFANGDRRFIVAIHGNHLDVFTLSDWRTAKKERLKAKRASESPEIKKWLGSAFDPIVDAQYRIRLHPSFLPLVKEGSGNSVVIVGLEDHLEIWSPTKWQKFLKTGS